MRKWAQTGVLAFAFMGAWNGVLYSATPVPDSAQFFTAIVTVGGVAPADKIYVVHSPLRGISPVDKVAIVQGEAGASPTPSSVPFPDRITPASKPLGAGDEILVQLLYRVVPNGTPNPNAIPFNVINLSNPADPLPFAFEIPPGQITTGVVEYKIFAYRLKGGTTSQAETASYPPEAMTNPDATVEVGIQAGASRMFDAAGGRVEVFQGNPNVGETYLDIPAGLLTPGSNVALTQLPVNSPLVPPLGGLPSPVAVYRLDVSRKFGGSVLLNVLYPDFVYPIGQDGILDGTSTPETMSGIIFWDGFSWRKLGGRINTNLNTVTARIGNFQYIAVVPLGAIAPEDQRPMERILTPNGDGINDVAMFTFGDPTQSVTVNIFDTTGHRIRQVRGAGSLQWDGRDDSGKIVESGVYIYQYELDGKRVSGLIAVAK